MVWQSIPIGDVSVDADRWRRLNNYFRQDVDAIADNLRLLQAGESYRNAGTTFYDMDGNRTVGPGTNAQIFQWNAVWVPEGVFAAYWGVQCLATVSSANLFLRCTMTNFTTGVASFVDLINLPVGVGWSAGTVAGMAGNDMYDVRMDVFNNTGANQTVRFRELLVRADVP